MPEPQIVTLGEKELRAKFAGLKKDVGGKGLGDATLAGGYIVEKFAKLDAPVDTGFHRGAIRAELVETSPSRAVVDVSFGSEYGIYLEMGTVKMDARPHLKPALTSHVPEIENAAAQTFINFITKYITAK